VYPGAGGAAYEVPNPLTVDSAMSQLLRVAREYPGTDVVSITGGEPLEQPDFVCGVASSIKRAGKRVYLETNGVHDEALAAVLPWTDVVAMDIKLPSATRAPLWDAHRAFLARLENTVFVPGSIAGRTGGKAVFVKVVIDDRSERQEVESAAAMIASTSPAIPLVLQPESGLFLEDTRGDERAEKLKTSLADCYDAAAAVLDDVRIVPQVHRLLNVR
jgi:pyruvate-formate lyase-activating enzyme